MTFLISSSLPSGMRPPNLPSLGVRAYFTTSGRLFADRLDGLRRGLLDEFRGVGRGEPLQHGERAGILHRLERLDDGKKIGGVLGVGEDPAEERRGGGRGDVGKTVKDRETVFGGRLGRLGGEG